MHSSPQRPRVVLFSTYTVRNEQRDLADRPSCKHCTDPPLSTNMTDVNLLHVQWKNPELLAFLGAQKGGVSVGQSVLDASNVMEYFSTSPFYDRRSNNEHVRMQSAALIAQAMATTQSSGPELMQVVTQTHEEELKYVPNAVGTAQYH